MPEQLCLQFGPSQHLQSLFLLPRLIFPNMPFMAQPHQIILNPMCAIYFQNFMTVIYPRLLCFSPLFGEIYQACKTHITTLVEISVNTCISFAKLATSSPMTLSPERRFIHQML